MGRINPIEYFKEAHGAVVTSPFGPRKDPLGGGKTVQHYGTDLGGKPRRHIWTSPFSGEVTHIGKHGGRGLVVVVLIKNTFMAIYSFVYGFLFSENGFEYWGNTFFAVWMLFLLPVIIAFIFNSTNYLESVSINLSLINNEIFIRELSKLDERVRAEKIYNTALEDTRAFYTINNRHIKFLFPVGIFLMFCGVLIVALSLVLTYNTLHLLIGVLCGILIDFIGALFISMYNKNLENSLGYFENLHRFNDLLYINVVISQISDEQIKNKTLAEVATEMSKR